DGATAGASGAVVPAPASGTDGVGAGGALDVAGSGEVAGWAGTDRPFSVAGPPAGLSPASFLFAFSLAFLSSTFGACTGSGGPGAWAAFRTACWMGIALSMK